MKGISSGLTAVLARDGHLLGLLSVALLTAGVLRLQHFDSSRVNAEHQYAYAVIARLAFFTAVDSIPPWRKDVAAAAIQQQRIFEPPIFPYATGLGYRVLGHETLALPRLLATLAWLLGGVLLFFLATRLTTGSAALVAALYFLFVPSGVQLSVSFLPESPMVMVIIASLLAVVLFFERQSTGRFIVAWFASTLAIVIKPVALFPIVGAIIGLALSDRGSAGQRRRIGAAAALAGLATVGGSFYYLRDIVRGEDLAAHAGVSFIPGLLLEASYWKGWLQSASWAAGFVPLVLGVLGAAAMQRGRLRALVLGLWGGYIVYCLLFTYHIRFAGHYHVSLVPIVALSLTPFVPVGVRFIRSISGTWRGVAAVCLACVMMVWSSWERIALTVDSGPRFEPPRVAAEIGELVGHSSRTVFLSPYYGSPLMYFGELAGLWWPRPQPDPALREADSAESSVAERLRHLGFTPDYFIITDRAALAAHEGELEATLSRQCVLLAERPQYLIYDLRSCIDRLRRGDQERASELVETSSSESSATRHRSSTRSERPSV